MNNLKLNESVLTTCSATSLLPSLTSSQFFFLQSECLEILLTFGADANTPDQCGDTPVHIAKLYDQKYCISIIKNFQVKEEEEEEEEEEQEETPE